MMIGSFIGTWMADYSLKLIWCIPCISSLLFIITVIKFIEKSNTMPSNTSMMELYKTTLNYIKIGGQLIVKNRKLSYLYTLAALMGFVSSPLMVFWSVYLNEVDSSFSYLYLSAVWFLIQISIIAGNQILEWIGKYVGRPKILKYTFFIFGLSAILLNARKELFIAVFLICMQEVVWTIICSVQRGLLNDYIEDQNRATMLSFSSLFNAIGKIAASVLFGFLADMFSVLFAWTMAGILALFTVWFVDIMYKKIL